MNWKLIPGRISWADRREQVSAVDTWGRFHWRLPTGSAGGAWELALEDEQCIHSSH